MAYSTTAEVLAIVDTDMSAAEISDIIDEVDDFMDAMLDTGALGANILRAISRTWSAYRAMLKDPNARKLGEYSENRAVQLARLWDQVMFFMLHSDGGITMQATREELA